ncbi:hypothetical protein BGW41_003051 [Actinomortierella wolfii]|nr:hypothetical protein BGW41_003051 [Actinomortierella wolfii]
MVQTSATSSSALSLPTPQYVPQDMTLSLESINIRLLSEALQREGFADLGNWMALTQQQHEVMALTMQQQQQQQQQQQPEQSLLPPSPALTTTTNDNASTAYPTQQQQQQQQPANPVYQGLQEYANVAPFVQTADDLQFNLLVFGDNTVSPFPGTLFNNDQSSIETHGFLHAAGKDEMGLGALDPLASFNSHQLPFTTTYGSGQNINSQLSSAQALVSDGGPGSSSSAHPPAMPFLNGTGLGDLFQFDPKLAEWMRSTQTSYFPEAPEPYDSDDEHGEVDGGLADYDQDAVPGLISDDAPAVSQSPATNKRSYDDYAAQQQGHPFNYAQQDPFSGARKHAKMSKTEQKRRHSHSRNNSVATVSDMMYENAYYQQQHQQQQQQQQQPSSSPLHPRSSHPSDDESQGSSSSSSSAHLPKTIEKRVHHCTVPGCDKAFTRAFNLRSHLNTHNGERPHKCPHADCNWDFVRRHDLDRHIKSKHMPDKPYACTKCTSRFGRSDALQRHRRLEGH